MAQSDQTSLLPLRLVVARTGLKPETIRAWERRYGAVHPARTPGGTRMFSEEDVSRLLHLKALRDRGRGLISIAKLPTERLAEMAGAERQHAPPEPREAPPPLSEEQQTYLTHIEKLDARGASAILDGLTRKLGNVEVLVKVAIPIMWQVGHRWTEGSLGVAQEHLVSAQLRRLLLGRLDKIDSPPNAPKLLFTTPAGQPHEFGILAGSVAAKEAGFDVLYLGPELPAEEIIWSVAQSKADVLVLSVIRRMSEEEMVQVERLVETLAPRVPIWIGCPPGHPLKSRTPRASHISSIQEFQSVVAELLQSA
ncbi:MAG: MerR family transcriptional regulator [Polyangiales bacterium]